MKINLRKFESKGLRSPNFIYEFNKNGKKRVHFLQMPNGTAKTTTLELFRSSFAEKKWSSDEVLQLKEGVLITKKGTLKFK